MTKTALVIDGDIFLWECALGSEVAWDWGDDMWTLHGDAREARQRFDIEIADLKEKLNASVIAIALSGEKNWRKDVLPTYKAHRKKTRKPLLFHTLKQYVRDAYNHYEYPNLEADDVCGILMGRRLWQTKFEKILVSTDKDLKQIKGLHYNPGRPEEDVSEVTPADGHYNHLLQTLTGDAVDGDSGCPGSGPKTAARILKPDPCWETDRRAYEDQGFDEEDALQQARVAYIMREGDYNFETNEVKLWEPRG